MVQIIMKPVLPVSNMILPFLCLDAAGPKARSFRFTYANVCAYPHGVVCMSDAFGLPAHCMTFLIMRAGCFEQVSSKFRAVYMVVNRLCELLTIIVLAGNMRIFCDVE